jgi:hypothetical protein
MVIKSSACTFDVLVRSYNSGDQGFLNEVFM